MKINLPLITKTAATLLGLSFAALVFAYNCAYDQKIPDAFKARMPVFLAYVIATNLLFFAASLVSLIGGTIGNADSPSATPTSGSNRVWWARCSLALFIAGLASYLFALLVIVGLGQAQIIIKIPYLPTFS